MIFENILTDIGFALKGVILPFEILGAVTFGSRVKGKATIHSDIDLLIVADRINPKRHRRGEEILLIKKILPPFPLDILLVTPSETISNFENHNPLFLDIAEDGIILLDKNNFLSSLIEKTRKYIHFKGIRRLKDGWEFPIEYRTATYLSMVSNRDFSMAMFKDGQRDYAIGKKLLDEGFYDKSVYHFQQCIEKCIKSILIAFGVFQKTHFVGEMLLDTLKNKELPETWSIKLTKIAEISESVEPEVGLSRYPGIINNALWMPSEEYEKIDAEKAREKADEVISITEGFIKFWFL
jgi:HEPN domain-containing protein